MTDTITVKAPKRQPQPNEWHWDPSFCEPVDAPSFLTATHRRSGTRFQCFAYPIEERKRKPGMAWRIMAFAPLSDAAVRQVDWSNPLLWARQGQWDIVPSGAVTPQEPPQQLGFAW